MLISTKKRQLKPRSTIQYALQYLNYLFTFCVYLNNKTTFLPILFNVDFYLPASHRELTIVIFGFTALHEMFKRKATIFLLKLLIKPVRKCLLPSAVF